jgi:hypothetical protein
MRINMERIDYSEIVAERFDQLVELKNKNKANWLFVDIAIWEVVCFRCSSDIGGYLDPFEQYFDSENHFNSFIEILKKLDEDFLVKQFSRVKELLSDFDFWTKREMRSEVNANFDHKEVDNGELYSILRDIDQKQLLWNLDDKLGEIYSDSV